MSGAAVNCWEARACAWPRRLKSEGRWQNAEWHRPPHFENGFGDAKRSHLCIPCRRGHARERGTYKTGFFLSLDVSRWVISTYSLPCRLAMFSAAPGHKACIERIPGRLTGLPGPWHRPCRMSDDNQVFPPEAIFKNNPTQERTLTMSRRHSCIDLGTTNSTMSVMEGGRSRRHPQRLKRHRTTPSILVSPSTRTATVSSAGPPKALWPSPNPHNTIYSVKRLIGRTCPRESRERSKTSPTRSSKRKNGDAWIERQGRRRKPSSSPPNRSPRWSWRSSKADGVEAYLGEKITAGRGHRARSTSMTPSAPGHQGRQGAIAGLEEVLRIINEPTAASLAYGLDKKSDEKRDQRQTSAAAPSTCPSSKSASASASR